MILEKKGDSKIMLNGKYLTFATQLNHLDRLLFGSSQYFVFYDPKKKKDDDIIATFDILQDEIALNAGLKYNDSKMSQGILFFYVLHYQTTIFNVLPVSYLPQWLNSIKKN